MAVPTGSNTETLHGHPFRDVDNLQTLIFGVQHHIYTVLSIIVNATALDATTDQGFIQFVGYELHSGSGTATTLTLAKFNIQVGETYVWNDKFSFNGTEPNTTNALNATVQALCAAQGTATVQKLNFDCTSSDDGGQSYDILCTYLDQDWT